MKYITASTVVDGIEVTVEVDGDNSNCYLTFKMSETHKSGPGNFSGTLEFAEDVGGIVNPNEELYLISVHTLSKIRHWAEQRGY